MQEPFLALPLAKATPDLSISQGWLYSEDERSIHPVIPVHYGVDVPLPWGTPIFAAADGWAVASYHTNDIVDSQGRTIGFGLGLFVQIWHEEPELYSLYAHLSGLNEAHFSAINGCFIPYIEPVLEGGSWQPRGGLYLPVDEFIGQAEPVIKGDLIGYAGYTGLRLDYDETPAYIPNIDPAMHKTWDPHGSHLHFEVYTRTPDGAMKDKRYDPFGLYGERDQYADVFTKAHGLILANPDGSPQFAR